MHYAGATGKLQGYSVDGAGVESKSKILDFVRSGRSYGHPKAEVICDEVGLSSPHIPYRIVSG
jgi:hypothetical protein